MANEIDYEALSDEEFMAQLEEDVVADEIEDEIAGEDIDDNEEVIEEEEEENTDSDLDNEEDTDDEDTDHTDDENDDSDTNDQDDDSEQDTDEENDSEGEENTRVEDDSSKDSDEDSEDDTKDSDDKDDSESKDDAETNDQSDGEGTDTDEIDYKKEYERFKGFYDEVTSEFTANGKKIKGFDDPKKIIQAQQMAAGFSDKMAGFKQYRPYMSPLKERGMLDDPKKFDLAMSLIDGDTEALKQHIKTLDIDPMDLDLEDIKYEHKVSRASDAELSLDDVLSNAESYGVKDEVYKVLGEQWDRGSVTELLNDPQSGHDLVNHLSSGAYDAVQERISEKKRTDVTGAFSGLNSITQYRQAALELESEYKQHIEAEKPKAEKLKKEQQARIEAEKAKIEADRKEAEYKAQVEKKNREAAKAREAATSVSKKKPKAKTKPKTFDPMELSDEEFTKQLDNLIYG